MNQAVPILGNESPRNMWMRHPKVFREPFGSLAKYQKLMQYSRLNQFILLEGCCIYFLNKPDDEPDRMRYVV